MSVFELGGNHSFSESWWFVYKTRHTHKIQACGTSSKVTTGQPNNQHAVASTRTGEVPFVETRGGAQCQPSLRRRWPVCTGFPTRYPETTRGGRYWVCLVKHWKKTVSIDYSMQDHHQTKNIYPKKQKGTYHYNFQSDPPESVFVQHDRYPPVTLE